MKRTLPPRSRRVRAAALASALLVTLTGCIQLPKLEDALAKARQVPETSKVYAADGSFITDLHAEENRENIPLDQMPKVVRDAVIAIEDERFYDHPGVDVRAIVRAFFRNTEEGKVVEGGSTITQQYVKNVLIQREKTFKRKINEAALAYQLEKKHTKDEILERYLNTVYFGQGAYGIEAAAKQFFGINAKDLNLAQASLLAGLIKSPSRYDPLVDPDTAKERRNTVLARMSELGYITPEEEAKVAATSLALKPAPKLERYEAAYFVEWIHYLIQYDPRFSMFGSSPAERANALFKGGLRIHTTVDLKLQRFGEIASREVLTERKDPYNALLAMDPDTGAVKAMVGGRDFFDPNDPYAKLNLTRRPMARQPGSSFKPFALAAALEKGIGLNKVYRGGSQISIPLGGGEVWSPRNYESLSFGASLTVREATVKSVNVVYAQLVRDIGAQAVVDMAKRLGIESELKPYLSISLGAQEVNPLEMAVAYSAFANGGYRVKPHGITKITDSSGKTLYEWKPTKEEVLSPRVVDRVNDALEDVVKFGTGRRQRLTGRPTAGKTGTADEYHDAWFAGYTRQMVAISWVGFPKAQIPMYPPYTRIRVVGGSWPGRIWKLFMDNAMADVPALPFESRPSGDLVTVEIDVTRNCRPNRYTPPNLIERVEFEKGKEPKDVCTEPSSPVPVQVPSVVGRTEGDARALLENAGLFAKSIERASCRSAGIVCEQFPTAGTTMTAGESVTIILGGDEPAGGRVPPVVGMSRQAAISRLRSAGFTVDYIFAENGSVDPGGCSSASESRSDTVWAQSICGDVEAPAGAKVTVYVNPIG